MKAHWSPKFSLAGLTAGIFLFLVILGCAACSSQATPTLFIPPTAEATQAITTLPANSATPAPSASPSPTLTPVIATPTPCTNDLQFVQDVTVPDGTSATPGERLDKQWLVTNSGTCNWDASYKLKLITGDAMGAPTEQVLYPARAGTQATVRIVFSAPPTTGNYTSAWQAVAPDGSAFGEALTMQINVTP